LAYWQHHITKNRAGNVRTDVTSRRVRVTNVAVEKKYVLHILSVRL